MTSREHVQAQQTHEEEETSFIETAGISSNGDAFRTIASIENSSTIDEPEISKNQIASTSTDDNALQMVVVRTENSINYEPEWENQVALPLSNSNMNPLADWSSGSEWSVTTESSVERDRRTGKLVQHTPNGTNQLQIPQGNGPKFINTFTGNGKVCPDFHNTRNFNAPVNYQNNIYCCPSELCYSCKSPLNKLLIGGVTSIILVIAIIIFLCIWFLIPSTPKRLYGPVAITSTTSESGRPLKTTDPVSTEPPDAAMSLENRFLPEQYITSSSALTTTDFVSTSSTNTFINTRKKILPSKVTPPPSEDYSFDIEGTSEGKNKNKNETIMTNSTLKIITRNEWDAAPSTKPHIKLKELPAPRVIISETKTQTCDELEKCMKIVRGIQRTSQLYPHPDIVYNFLVGGDGLVYEGRGWDVEGGVSYFSAKKSISIAFIGNFSSIIPSQRQIRAALKLIQFGIENRHISMFYELMGEKKCVLMSTNPGDKLYNIITKWQRWDPEDDMLPPKEESETLFYNKLFAGTKLRYIPKKGRN